MFPSFNVQAVMLLFLLRNIRSSLDPSPEIPTRAMSTGVPSKVGYIYTCFVADPKPARYNVSWKLVKC